MVLIYSFSLDLTLLHIEESYMKSIIFLKLNDVAPCPPWYSIKLYFGDCHKKQQLPKQHPSAVEYFGITFVKPSP